MTIDWALLLLVAGASFFLGTQFRNPERFWFLPYRERCRRLHPVAENKGWIPAQCKNRVWRIRWSSLAPLSVVCGECRRADVKRRVGA